MIVIEKEAELKLLDELKTVREKPDGKRFIHYAFSGLGENEKSQVQELLTTKLIDNVLENPDVKAFVCEDSDVILMGDNLYTKNFDKLTLEIFKITQISKLREISNMYDVNNSWPLLYKLAKDKYTKIESREHNAKKAILEESAKKERAAILSGKVVDKELMSSVGSRRERRNEVNVMIVEDDAFSRKLIRNILNKGYEVIDVEDGKDAINTYGIIAPDIVFLDIELPDINGHEILETLLKYDPSAYIIMLSGNSDQENVIRAIKAGAKGFVTKPFVKDRLFKYIDECPTARRKLEKK